MVFLTIMLFLSCTAVRVFAMENEEKQIILKSPADLAVHATRANLGNPHVHFVIDSDLKNQCESEKKNLLKPETLIAYNAVRKKLDPEFNDSIEKQLDELENLGH